MMNLTAIIIVIIFITACTSTVDYTSKYSKKCLQLVKSSLLYKGWCPDSPSSLQSSTICYGVQSFPISTYGKANNVLHSYDEYEMNKNLWRERLFGSAFYARSYEVVDRLADNASLEIVSVTKKQWGTDGYFWDVRAIILNGENKGMEVTLPTYRHHLGKAWVDRAENTQIAFDSNFVVLSTCPDPVSFTANDMEGV